MRRPNSVRNKSSGMVDKSQPGEYFIGRLSGGFRTAPGYQPDAPLTVGAARRRLVAIAAMRNLMPRAYSLSATSATVLGLVSVREGNMVTSLHAGNVRILGGAKKIKSRRLGKLFRTSKQRAGTASRYAHYAVRLVPKSVATMNTFCDRHINLL